MSLMALPDMSDSTSDKPEAEISAEVSQKITKTMSQGRKLQDPAELLEKENKVIKATLEVITRPLNALNDPGVLRG